MINVARFAPYRDGSGDQEKMQSLLADAKGGDGYAIERVRPSDPRPSAEIVDVRARYDIGSLLLAQARVRNVSLFAQVYTADFERALGRMRSDPDEIRGHRRSLNTIMVSYHTSFGRQCDPSKFGSVVEVREQFTKTYEDSQLNDLYGYSGPEYVSYIREDHYRQWADSKSRLTTWDVVQSAESMLQLGLDSEALIASNGCDSQELRQFEANLSEVVAIANQ